MTKGETVIAEITVYGPSGVTYVNPADDLKNGKKRASFRLLNYMLTEHPAPSGSGTRQCDDSILWQHLRIYCVTYDAIDIQ